MAGLSAGVAFVDIVPQLKDFGRNISKGLDKHTKEVGRKATIAGAAIVAGLAIGAKAAINAASDMGETISKTQVVFGKSAAEIIKWGDTTARSLGIGKREALDAAAIFGVFGKSAGLTGDQLTKFSKPLVTAAADLASFHNVPVAEGLEAIRSGLAGETEPLRRFGILLNDAALREEALRQGLIKNAKEALTPQQKMLAAQALILKKLGPATGDFARTSDSAANKQKINAAVTADLTAKLGQGLLPAYTKLLDLGLRVVTYFSEHTGLAKVLAISLAALAVVFLTVSAAVSIANLAVGLFGGTAAAVALPLALVLLSVIALGVGLVLLWKKSETFRTIVTGAFNAIKAVAGAAVGFIRRHWMLLLAILGGPFGVVIGQVIKHWGTVKVVGAAAFNAVRSVVGFLIEKVGNLVGRVQDFIAKVRGVTGGPFDTVREKVGNLMEKIGDAIGRVGGFIGKLKDISAGPVLSVVSALKSVFSWLGSVIDRIGGLQGALNNLPDIPGLGILQQLGRTTSAVTIPGARTMSLAGVSGGLEPAPRAERTAGPGVVVQEMHVRTGVDIELVAAALWRKALAQ